MTDSTTASAKPASAPAVKTVADDMDSRRIFDTPAEATAYLKLMGETLSDFSTQEFAAVGINAEGVFDPAIYTDSMQVMVSTLRKAKGGIKAIVVCPIPSLTSLTADSVGTSWVERIIQKELNHVAVRSLREAEDISTVVDQMPTTRDAYISSARGEGGGIMETFNELYKAINSTLAAKAPVWAKARLPKNELKKAMQSKGYATEYFPALENRGETKPSLFVVALQLGIAGAKKKGLDATIFERWTETRDAQAFTASDDDNDDLDIGSLTDSLMTEEAKPAEAATA